MFDVCLVVTPGQHWEQQWSYLLSHFKPRDVYTIGALDRKVKPFDNYVQVENANEVPGTLVLLAPVLGRYVQGEVAIQDFQHPEDCCYMFGGDNSTMSDDFLAGRDPEHKVFIPTDSRDDMYSFMAGAITLYDRLIKNG